MKAAQDDLEINLRTDMPDSSLSVDYRSAAVPNGWELNLDARVEDLEFGALLRLLNPDATATGKLFVDISLTAMAAEENRILDSLNGHFDLVSFPRELGAAWLDIRASNLLFALLKAGDPSSKKMNCTVSRSSVENGVMKSRNSFLDTTDTIVRARGKIDLANRHLDLWIAPRAKVERFLSVQTPLQVTGPLDDFDVTVAPGGFITTALRLYYGLIIATCHAAMDWAPPGTTQ